MRGSFEVNSADPSPDGGRLIVRAGGGDRDSPSLRVFAAPAVRHPHCQSEVANFWRRPVDFSRRGVDGRAVRLMIRNLSRVADHYPVAD